MFGCVPAKENQFSKSIVLGKKKKKELFRITGGHDLFREAGPPPWILGSEISTDTDVENSILDPGSHRR